MFDSRGNIAYEPKFRKPKWVNESELERFNKFEDEDLAHLNSRNNRVIIENPFNRKPKHNKIWDHITADEVGKYMIGISYLERTKCDDKYIKECKRLINLSLV